MSSPGAGKKHLDVEWYVEPPKNVKVPSQEEAKPKKGTNGTVISDFAPVDPPYVPLLIQQCANELEKRGLNEEGPYRTSGNQSQVKELIKKFQNGENPMLANAQMPDITSCLKQFLRGLKETLIPASLWKDFANAANNGDKKSGGRQMQDAVDKLPPVNRDCIAFIFGHLHRVAKKEAVHKMSPSNLALVFGPTIMGNSTPNPTMTQATADAELAKAVATRLLELTPDYWKDVLFRYRVALESRDKGDKEYFMRFNVHDFQVKGKTQPGNGTFNTMVIDPRSFTFWIDAPKVVLKCKVRGLPEDIQEVLYELSNGCIAITLKKKAPKTWGILEAPRIVHVDDAK